MINNENMICATVPPPSNFPYKGKDCGLRVIGRCPQGGCLKSKAYYQIVILNGSADWRRNEVSIIVTNRFFSAFRNRRFALRQ